MINGRILHEFLARSKGSANDDGLHETLNSLARTLGFNQFAMGHRVDLARPPSGAMRLSIYNEDWVSYVIERRYFADDSMHIANTKVGIGVFWRDVSDLIQFLPRQSQILTAVVDFDLREGFTVPVYPPREFPGICSFAAALLNRVDETAALAAAVCGRFVFEVAKRMINRKLRLDTAAANSRTSRRLDPQRCS